MNASSLHSPEVARTLDGLHRRARTDLLRIALVAPFVVPDFFGLRKIDDRRLSKHMRRVFVPVTRSQGQMLYLVARSIGARRIVEFGTSFGISTLYLAAAAKDNGGIVIGSEIEPAKARVANANLADAGLGAFVEVRVGDARETLRNVGGPVDFLLLDSWIPLVRPVIDVVAP
ncbi:MAG TPA: class I SAM-dependent methyltransferase, partial [Polyangiaceae bacterium]|nr:class I SAM-dependent methyltransferase [Polyangiaceae bacterium]